MVLRGEPGLGTSALLGYLAGRVAGWHVATAVGVVPPLWQQPFFHDAFWHINDAALQPLFGRSFLLQEVQPLSQNLSAVSAAGLAALEYIDHAQSAPADWMNQQLGLVAQAQKPQAQLLLVVAPAIEKLIRAAASHN